MCLLIGNDRIEVIMEASMSTHAFLLSLERFADSDVMEQEL
jgi:hypothetical protein